MIKLQLKRSQAIKQCMLKSLRILSSLGNHSQTNKRMLSTKTPPMTSLGIINSPSTLPWIDRLMTLSQTCHLLLEPFTLRRKRCPSILHVISIIQIFQSQAWTNNLWEVKAALEFAMRSTNPLSQGCHLLSKSINSGCIHRLGGSRNSILMTLRKLFPATDPQFNPGRFNLLNKYFKVALWRSRIPLIKMSNLK